MNIQSILMLVAIAVFICVVAIKLQVHIIIYAVILTALQMMTKVRYSCGYIWGLLAAGTAACVAFGWKGLILSAIPIVYARLEYELCLLSDQYDDDIS